MYTLKDAPANLLYSGTELLVVNLTGDFFNFFRCIQEIIYTAISQKYSDIRGITESRT